MNNPYKSEKEYLDNIQKFLGDCGFTTWREVVPDIHKDKEFPFRIDLIFYRKDVGYIAVEGKNIRSLRQGSIFAKAVEQINKYRNLTFFNGVKIKKWCISAPLNIAYIVSKDIEEIVLNEITHFIKHFLNYYFDISLLELDLKRRVVIDRYIKDRLIYITKDEVRGEGLCLL